MKIFLSIFFLWVLVFGSKIEYDMTGNQLVYLYRQSKDLYSIRVRDESFKNVFSDFYHKLGDFMKQKFRENPTLLFQIIRENGNFQAAYFVVLALSFDMYITDMYDEIANTNFASTKFFERSKSLVVHLLRQKDWPAYKEAFAIFLSIQRQYLVHLKPNREKWEKVGDWISSYEFVYQSYDPSDRNAFHSLFYNLQSIAKRFKGKIPKSKPNRFYVLNLLRLFEAYRNYSFIHDWENLNVKEIDASLLCLILLAEFPKSRIFEFLINPKVSASDFGNFSFEFAKVVATYEVKARTLFFTSSSSFHHSTRFYKYLQSVNCGNTYNFEGKRLWFIKTLLHLISVFGRQPKLHPAN
jgi:hypothetical protein